MSILTTNNDELTGTWRLEKYAVTNQNNQSILLWGKNAAGLLIYQNNKYMSVHVSNKDRPYFSQDDFLAGDMKEVRIAFEGYTAYYGEYDYRPDKSLVYHYVKQSAFPNWSGITHTRYVSLNQDKLTLSTPPIQIKNELCKLKMFWQKMN